MSGIVSPDKKLKKTIVREKKTLLTSLTSRPFVTTVKEGPRCFLPASIFTAKEVKVQRTERARHTVISTVLLPESCDFSEAVCQ